MRGNLNFTFFFSKQLEFCIGLQWYNLVVVYIGVISVYIGFPMFTTLL